MDKKTFLSLSFRGKSFFAHEYKTKQAWGSPISRLVIFSVEQGIFMTGCHKLMSKFGTLIPKYKTLTSKYDTLRSKYRTLASKYGTLISKYNILVPKYETLRSEYGDLISKCDIMTSKHVVLTSYSADIGLFGHPSNSPPDVVGTSLQFLGELYPAMLFIKNSYY